MEKHTGLPRSKIIFAKQGILGVIISPTELKMQPTIHLLSKPGYTGLSEPADQNIMVIVRAHIQVRVANVLLVAFSISPGSLSLVKYLYITFINFY
jgi:hypothetical protein